MKFEKQTVSVFTKIIRFAAIGLISSLLSSFILEFMYAGFDFEHIFMFIQNNSEIYLISAAVFFTIYLWITSLSGSSIMGGSLTVVTSLVLGTASYLKFQYRSEPLYPSELSMVTELPFLLNMLSIQELIAIVGILLVIFSVIFLIYRKFSLSRRYKTSKKLSFIWRSLIFIASTTALIHIYNLINLTIMLKLYTLIILSGSITIKTLIMVKMALLLVFYIISVRNQ